MSYAFGFEVEFEHPACNNMDYVDAFCVATDSFGCYTDDRSLRGYGGEFVSRIFESSHLAQYNFRKLAVKFNECFNVELKDATTSRTSVHIHFSNRLIRRCFNSAGNFLEVLARAQLVEELLLKADFIRPPNNYCTPERINKVIRNCAHVGGTVPFSSEAARRAVSDYGNKYCACNILNLTNEESSRTLEFRIFPTDISPDDFSLACNLIKTVMNYGIEQSIVNQINRLDDELNSDEYACIITWLAESGYDDEKVIDYIKNNITQRMLTQYELMRGSV